MIEAHEKDTYASLLASRDLLGEHPRKKQKFLNAIREQKPSWVRGRPEYVWTQAKKSLSSLANATDDPPVDVEGVVPMMEGQMFDDESDDEMEVDAVAGTNPPAS